MELTDVTVGWLASTESLSMCKFVSVQVYSLTRSINILPVPLSRDTGKFFHTAFNIIS